jgi:hypothetical protein
VNVDEHGNVSLGVVDGCDTLLVMLQRSHGTADGNCFLVRRVSSSPIYVPLVVVVLETATMCVLCLAFGPAHA